MDISRPGIQPGILSQMFGLEYKCIKSKFLPKLFLTIQSGIVSRVPRKTRETIPGFLN